jgi:two-component system, NarL family, nitrate/nitrite response regulator NarL
VTLEAREIDHQILSLLATGHTNREIGQSLYLAEDTIGHRLTRLMRRFEARNRAHLVYSATCAGIVRLPVRESA